MFLLFLQLYISPNKKSRPCLPSFLDKHRRLCRGTTVLYFIVTDKTLSTLSVYRMGDKSFLLLRASPVVHFARSVSQDLRGATLFHNGCKKGLYDKCLEKSKVFLHHFFFSALQETNPFLYDFKQYFERCFYKKVEYKNKHIYF